MQSQVDLEVVSRRAAHRPILQEKTGAWQQALLVLGALPQHAILPDTITLNAILSAMEKSRQWRKARQCFLGRVGASDASLDYMASSGIRLML